MPDAGPSSSLSHPLEVGARALCSRGEDERPEVEVIERRSKDGDLPQYYVHFVGQDRRLDEWVDAARLGPLQVGRRGRRNVPEKLHEAWTGPPRAYP